LLLYVANICTTDANHNMECKKISPVTKQQPPKHISAYMVKRTDRSAAAICSESVRLVTVLTAIFWKASQPSSICL